MDTPRSLLYQASRVSDLCAVAVTVRDVGAAIAGRSLVALLTCCKLGCNLRPGAHRVRATCGDSCCFVSRLLPPGHFGEAGRGPDGETAMRPRCATTVALVVAVVGLGMAGNASAAAGTQGAVNAGATAGGTWGTAEEVPGLAGLNPHWADRG